MTLPNGMLAAILAVSLLGPPQPTGAAEPGLITKASRYSVPETIERFEAAIKAKGWLVFAELDHAVAAAKVGLQLPPRTVVLFGNPRLGTGPMQMAPTLAIDNPPKALVWQDDHGKVWLTYNTADYIASHIYPRHALTIPAEGLKTLEQFLAETSDQATK